MLYYKDFYLLLYYASLCLLLSECRLLHGFALLTVSILICFKRQIQKFKEISHHRYQLISTDHKLIDYYFYFFILKNLIINKQTKLQNINSTNISRGTIVITSTYFIKQTMFIIIIKTFKIKNKDATILFMCWLYSTVVATMNILVSSVFL